MKRATIFAHYDKDNIIDDYVIYYLKELKRINSDIIFVSCNNIQDKKKLNEIATYIIDEKHNEYDFGSYKRGFLYLLNNKLLDDYDEIIFANDSCYGPFYPLDEVFSEMETKECDFWGITKNMYGYNKKPNHFFVKRPHIQSYFIVFKKNVFTSDCFINFVYSITQENNKKNIISKYEIGLTEILAEQGFKYDVLINAYERINNITILKWRQILLKHNMPFMKCSLPRLINNHSTTVEGYEKILEKYNYPIELIKNNIKRIENFENIKHTIPIKIKRLIFDTLAEFPFFIRKFISIIISRCFSFVIDHRE